MILRFSALLLTLAFPLTVNAQILDSLYEYGNAVNADDESGAGSIITAGDTRVIPPARPHHLVVEGPVRFHVEFHR